MEWDNGHYYIIVANFLKDKKILKIILKKK